MVKSIVRSFQWTPETINGLYLDGIDHFGLKYWYDDCKEVEREMKKKK
jgi:hypothetical protein